MFLATIRMELTAGRAAEAMDILRPLVERTKAEPGCISCHLYRDEQEGNTIMMEELWATQEDLHRHLCSPQYQRVLLVIELAKGTPEIRFDTITHTRGFETVIEARDHTEGLAEEAR